ncbi:MFS transporter [Bradyrhizobium sp.]|uniref:MFS transporter n=1 Tax=Bradyrhizobium sp. TaxID=376 RepID=UPI003C61963A
MRIHPDSFALTLLLGLLSSLPTFGIDMILPSLSATGADLGAAPADVGQAMSAYLLGLGAALLVYGPVSDRLGRKPIVVFGCALESLPAWAASSPIHCRSCCCSARSRGPGLRAREWPP